MTTAQLYNLANTATQEVLGETALIKEDWSNLVDVGDSIANALGTEKFYNSLVNQIGRMWFVNRPYTGNIKRFSAMRGNSALSSARFKRN